MSGYYGMAADHVMALEVVTASGHFVTASNTSHPDLFWALRGGGGSTFGVVTSVVIRVHPKIHVTTSEFTIQTDDGEAYFAALRGFFDRFVEWTDAGTYSFFRAGVAEGVYTLGLVPFFAPNYTVSEYEELVGPWVKEVRDLGIEFEPTTKFHESYYPAWEQTWGRSVGLNTVGAFMLPGNRLFPRGNFEDPEKFDETFSVLRKHIEGGTGLIGYHQAPRNRANVDNAVSSAFRNVVAFLIAGVNVGPDTGAEEMGAAARFLQEEVLAPWREVAPSSEGGGSYLNEASVMEPNWQAEFYGEKYPRLLEIKKDVDPLGVFYATTAVGSEEWEVTDGDQGVQTQNGRLCRL
jgi:FAD/FMN-containing dehydrogenase